MYKQIKLKNCKNLSEETEFSSYVNLLSRYAKTHLVIIAASDTPCGSEKFTVDIAIKLMELGFTIPLHNKWRCSYAAILDAGKLVFEGISQTHPVSCELDLKGTSVKVESLCYGVVGGVRNCNIIINGKSCASKSRGLAFAVFDKSQGILLDSVKFDTYLPDIPCKRVGENPLYKAFMEKHPGVTFINPVYPIFPETNLSPNEAFIVKNKIDYHIIKAKADILKSPINEYIDNADGIREVLTTPKAYIGTDGVRRFYDQTGKYLNVVNGHRLTVAQPANAKRVIYTVGGAAYWE